MRQYAGGCHFGRRPHENAFIHRGFAEIAQSQHSDEPHKSEVSRVIELLSIELTRRDN